MRLSILAGHPGLMLALAIGALSRGTATVSAADLCLNMGISPVRADDCRAHFRAVRHAHQASGSKFHDYVLRHPAVQNRQHRNAVRRASMNLRPDL